MQHIPRRPQAIQIETAGSNVTFGNFGKLFLAVCESAEVAITLRILNQFQFRYDVVSAFFETYVASRGPHETDRRKVMSGNMAGEIFGVSVPTAIGFCLWLKASALAEIGEHAVRFKLEQIISVEVLGMFERTASQPHS